MRLKALTILAATLPLWAIHDPVRVEQGLLSGAQGTRPGVQAYKGIPFAMPPIGDMRWKAPKPPASWQGVRKAAQFSPVCYQTPYPKSSIYYNDPEPMSEDCLYLNVWTAAKSNKERRPVMVWIHGGALTRGSGSLSYYDGDALAAKGVVLVTINYRLGLFGFFAHPELTKESDRNTSGNYGLLDQLAALEWVQKNIAAFGGDPKRVTIFGESAGSWSVNYLMATPLAKGLFQAVIGESGGTFADMRKLRETEAAGQKFATAAGADSLQALRAKPAEEILKMPSAMTATPNVDGWMFPEDVYTIFTKGKQNDVPLLAGSNADEAKSLAPWPASGTAASFIDQSRRRFGDKTGEFLKVYPAGSNEEAMASHYASFRDFVFGWQMRTWVRAETKTGKSKAYLYYFSRVTPGPNSAKLGAYHASEIAYVFENLLPPSPWQETDRKLSDALSSYWVNFAFNHDPNGKGLEKWPAYDQKTDIALEFGDKIAPVQNLNKAALDFLDNYFASQRAAQATQ